MLLTGVYLWWPRPGQPGMPRAGQRGRALWRQWHAFLGVLLGVLSLAIILTGITWSPDRKTVFVGIQHPGEKGDSHFPRGGDTVPRSCVVAIRRNDGGLIG